MNIVKSHIEWNLTFEGEVMVGAIFHSYEECRDYVARSPHDADKYQIISRIVVTETSDWAVWK